MSGKIYKHPQFVFVVSDKLTVIRFRYAAALAAFGLLIAYYTGEYSGQCKLHEFFASINLLICIGLSVVSILPKVSNPS